jgi:hypothetical protein
VLGDAAGGLDCDLFDRRIEPERAAEVLEESHEAADKRPGASLGKEHTPLPLDPVDQRVDGACLQRIAADEQGVEAECLPEVLILDEA